MFQERKFCHVLLVQQMHLYACKINSNLHLSSAKESPAVYLSPLLAPIALNLYSKPKCIKYTEQNLSVHLMNNNVPPQNNIG